MADLEFSLLTKGSTSASDTRSAGGTKLRGGSYADVSSFRRICAKTARSCKITDVGGQRTFASGVSAPVYTIETDFLLGFTDLP